MIGDAFSKGGTRRLREKDWVLGKKFFPLVQEGEGQGEGGIRRADTSQGQVERTGARGGGFADCEGKLKGGGGWKNRTTTHSRRKNSRGTDVKGCAITGGALL